MENHSKSKIFDEDVNPTICMENAPCSVLESNLEVCTKLAHDRINNLDIASHGSPNIEETLSNKLGSPLNEKYQSGCSKKVEDKSPETAVKSEGDKSNEPKISLGLISKITGDTGINVDIDTMDINSELEFEDQIDDDEEEY